MRVSAEAPPGSEGSGEKLLAGALDDALRSELLKGLKTSFEWIPADPVACCGDAVHAAAVEEALAPLETATLAYPRVFLDFVRANARRMIPGGVALVSDYGLGRRVELAGEVDPDPSHYGNTLNHPVPFPVLDAFFRHAGLPATRTRDPFSSIFTIAVRYGPPASKRLARVFRRVYVRRSDGQELLELRAAAGALHEARDLRGAARLYRRCLELDPESPDLHCRLGAVCTDARWDGLALRYLRRGQKLDPDRTLDFGLLLGRVYLRRGQWGSARRAFRRSIARAPNAHAYIQLGLALEKLEDYKNAYVSYRRALELDSTSEAARKLMLKVIDQYLPKAWAVDVVDKEK